MDIKHFFGNLGHALISIFGLIRKIVPNDQLLRGIELAEAAAIKWTDNAQRRAWVSAELQAQFHIPEYVANLIVELAVAHLKDAVQKAGDTATGAVANPA